MEVISQVDWCVAIPIERLPHFVKGEGLLESTETTFICKKNLENNLINPAKHAIKMYSRFV